MKRRFHTSGNYIFIYFFVSCFRSTNSLHIVTSFFFCSPLLLIIFLIICFQFVVNCESPSHHRV